MSLFGCFQLDGVPAGEPCGPALVLLVLGAQAVDRGDDLNVTIPQFQDLLDRLDLISAGGLLESRPAALTVVRLVGFVRFPILRSGLAYATCFDLLRVHLAAYTFYPTRRPSG